MLRRGLEVLSARAQRSAAGAAEWGVVQVADVFGREKGRDLHAKMPARVGT